MRRSRAHCSADYDFGPFGVHVSGSVRHVRAEFPKLVALVKQLEVSK